jgi:hypothetical protein
MTQLLPNNLEAKLDSTPTDDIDEITYLQGKLRIADDALTEAESKIKSLEAKVKILKDNSEIKKSAVGYAKISLILIPLACLCLLILSALGGRELEVSNHSFNISIDLNNYAQAALIVAPIAFFATIIGFLLKGAFGQNVDVRNLSTPDVLKSLNNDS